MQVADPLGNTRTGDWTDVTAATSGALSAYAAEVSDDGPQFYWRFESQREPQSTMP